MDAVGLAERNHLIEPGDDLAILNDFGNGWGDGRHRTLLTRTNAVDHTRRGSDRALRMIVTVSWE
jgi:hypothetical protein